jgi:hypothetical protein
MPVMADASSESRNATPFPISSASTRRPKADASVRSRWSRLPLSMAARSGGVATYPGDTELMRTPDRPPLTGKAGGKVDDGGFCDGIRVQRCRPGRGDGAGDDDRPGFSRGHARAGRKARYVNASKVYCDNPIELSDRQIFRPSARLDYARVGEQTKDRSDSGFDFGEGGFGGGLVRDVEGHRIATQLPGCVATLLDIYVRNDDTPSSIGKDAGRGKTNPARSAGDHGDAAKSFISFCHDVIIRLHRKIPLLDLLIVP